jgi:hypothetical protein
MKVKSFAMLFNGVLLASLILSACGAPATTQAPVATDEAPATEATAVPAAPATEAAAVPEGSIIFPDQIAGGRPVEISVVGIPTEANPTGLADWNAAVERFQAK